MKDTEAFAVVAGQVALISTLEGCRQYAETRARRDFSHIGGVLVEPVVVISRERYARLTALEEAIRRRLEIEAEKEAEHVGS